MPRLQAQPGGVPDAGWTEAGETVPAHGPDQPEAGASMWFQMVTAGGVCGAGTPAGLPPRAPSWPRVLETQRLLSFRPVPENWGGSWGLQSDA